MEYKETVGVLLASTKICFSVAGWNVGCPKSTINLVYLQCGRVGNVVSIVSTDT